MPEFQPNDRGEIRLTLGDRKPDGKIDLTVQVYAKIPLLDDKPEKYLDKTITPPTKQVLDFLSGAASLLPAPAAGAAQFVLGLARAVIG